MPVVTVVGECCCGSGIPAATCCTVQPDTLQVELSGIGLAWDFQSGGVFLPCVQIDLSPLSTGYTLTRVGDNIYSGSTDFSGGEPPYGTPIVSIVVECFHPTGLPVFWRVTLYVDLWGIGGRDTQVFGCVMYYNFCDPIIILFSAFTQETPPSSFDCLAMVAANPYWQDLYSGWVAEVYE